jgi:hypothetical protein
MDLNIHSPKLKKEALSTFKQVPGSGGGAYSAQELSSTKKPHPDKPVSQASA